MTGNIDEFIVEAMTDRYLLTYAGQGGHYTSADMGMDEALLEALLGAETGMIWPLSLKSADGKPLFQQDLVLEARRRFGGGGGDLGQEAAE